MTDLDNQFCRGTDQYPATLTTVYNLLVQQFKGAKKTERRSRDRNRQRVERERESSCNQTDTSEDTDVSFA